MCGAQQWDLEWVCLRWEGHGGRRMLAIGTLQSYSSDLPASLSLTQGQMTTNAPWLAWHMDQFTAGSHWVGAVNMGAVMYSRSPLGTSPSFPGLCLPWLWLWCLHFTTTTWMFLPHFPCPPFLSVPHGTLSRASTPLPGLII